MRKAHWLGAQLEEGVTPAVLGAYHYLMGTDKHNRPEHKLERPPTFREIVRCHDHHFMQEFAIDIIERQQFMKYDAKDEQDFREKLMNGAYDGHLPPQELILIALYDLQLVFLITDNEGMLENVGNCPHKEVW